MASVRLVVFELDGNEYAVDALSINGILRFKKFKVQRVPDLPKVVEGMINLRGNVNYIFNLRIKFGLTEKQPDVESKILMFNVHDSVAGCIVDEVTDIVKIEKSDIQAAPEFVSSVNTSYVKGIAKVGERLLIVINPDKILSANEYDSMGIAVN